MGKLFRAGLIALGVVIMATLSAGPAMAAKAAETVYLNGNIYTVDDKQPKASAVAITGQKLVYVGSDKGAKAYVGKGTKVVDLKGKTVLPGLIEGHMHFTGEGQKMLQVYVFWSPKAEIMAKVKAEAEKLPPGTWIIGRGWNQEVWPDKKFPTREDLDAVAPDHPVMLTRTCGHAIWVNSKALALAGIDRNTPDPEGGTIDRDAGGNPTGILHETARNLVRSKVTPMTNDRLKEAM
ncbi:MAG TPA: amidohydrolase family protein, partial [Syntrophales bacterium]|nr:amidohydrolase family protein [Syntrophales bacterium]